MSTPDSNTILQIPEGDNERKKNLPLTYPPSEDIYNQSRHEVNVDPEDTSKIKSPNETDFNEDFTGSDLDVPGSELDDAREAVGSEDEENNLYSLGDNQIDLKDYKGG